MKNTAFIFSFILFAVIGSLAQNIGVNPPEIIRVEPKPAKGFDYRYYLYVPKTMREPESAKRKHTILVIPNNAGKTSDEINVHEEDVKRKIRQNAQIADRMGVALLMPVFRARKPTGRFTHTPSTATQW